MGIMTLLSDGDSFNPRRLFLASTIGAIYDYDDFAYLYQKSDGSTPVTALEQPIGLVVDKRWGGAVGTTELVTNGSFATDTAWTKGADWSIGSGVATKVAGTATQLSQSNVVPLTGWCLVTFTAVVNAGNVFVRLGGTSTALQFNCAASGTYTVRLPVQGSDQTLRFTANASFAGTLDNVSVRELPGLHAYQSTDAARPVIKGAPRYLNLDGTDDRAVTATGGGSTTGFLLVTGINVSGAGTARTIFSDRGTNTGYKVEVDAANNLVFTAGNGASFVSCTGPAITAGTSYVIACWHDGANLNIKVGSGAVTSQAFSAASAGTAAISIGRDNGAATGFYNGRLYPTVYIKDSTAGVGAINATMAWVAGKGGIAL